MWVSVLLIGGLLFGGMIAPVNADVEDDPVAASQQAIAGDGMKHFFAGILMRIFRYDKSMPAFIGIS